MRRLRKPLLFVAVSAGFIWAYLLLIGAIVDPNLLVGAKFPITGRLWVASPKWFNLLLSGMPLVVLSVPVLALQYRFVNRAMSWAGRLAWLLAGWLVYSGLLSTPIALAGDSVASSLAMWFTMFLAYQVVGLPGYLPLALVNYLLRRSLFDRPEPTLREFGPADELGRDEDPSKNVL